MAGDNYSVKMGRSAYRIPSGGGFTVRKSQPPAQGMLHKMSRFIFGGSLPFQNEKYINSLLEQNVFTYFRYPKPINITEGDDNEFEYIEGKDLFNLNENELTMALNGLLEFNCLGKCCKQTGIQGIALRLLESPSIRTARFLLLSNLTLRKKLIGIILLLKQKIFYKNPYTVLLHNDLLFSNLRIDRDGNIYFIDFEDSVPESLLILADTIDLLFDRHRLTLDLKILQSHWLRMATRLQVNPDDLNMKVQARLCIMRLAVAGRSRTASEAEQRDSMDLLCNIVLDTKRYNNWYQEQCSQLSVESEKP